jgi:hypothetical protein
MSENLALELENNGRFVTVSVGEVPLRGKKEGTEFIRAKK